MTIITNQLKQDLKNLESDYAELDKEWERLDSTGQTEQQRQVASKMETIEKKIKGLKEVLGL